MTNCKDSLIEKPENPFAFPLPLGTMDAPEPAFGGMTLRDYFAAAAMQGFCGNSFLCEGLSASANKKGLDEAWINQVKAEKAYRLADAMLKARAI